MNRLVMSLFVYVSRTKRQSMTLLSSIYNFHSSKCLQAKLNCRRLVLVSSSKYTKRKYPVLLLWTIPFLSSSSEVMKISELRPKIVDNKRAIQQAIQEADELFASNKYEEAVTALLPHKDSGNVEVLWRLCRLKYNLSQLASVPEADKKNLIFDSYTLISEALESDDNHWAVHKWMSVLLDARSAYGGIKARISQLENVKNHMLRAVELNPKDATTFYMLGSWCYQIADMPWFQRKIAATIFAAPPVSSFEEALQYFSKAEEIQPGFYSKNLLMLGKTLLKLGRPKEATLRLIQARDYSGSTEEDNEVLKEAAEMLKKIKINESN